MKLINSFTIQEEVLSAFIARYHNKKITNTNFVSLYLNTLQDHWEEIIQQLDSNTLYLFSICFIKQGIDLSAAGEIIGEEKLLESIRVLESLSLCALRINISHLKISRKLYMFDEVREFFNHNKKIISLAEYQTQFQEMNISTFSSAYNDVPHAILQLFISYGFLVPVNILEQNFTPEAIKYVQETGFLTKKAFISADIPEKSIAMICYHLAIPEFTEAQHSFTQVRSFHTQVFNDLVILVLEIQKEGIKITKKDEMSKKSLDKLGKIIEHEPLLWFLLQFLKRKNFLVEISPDTYKVSETFFHFFKGSLKDTFSEFLKIDSVLQNILQVFQATSNTYLSFADIIVAYLKASPELILDYLESRSLRRNILQKIELLHYLGIINQHYTDYGISFYSISPFYKKSQNEHIIPKEILTISSSFQIMGNVDDIPPHVSYMLGIFGNIESLYPALSIKIDQATCHRAMYFGFRVEDLLNILNNYSKTTLDPFIHQSLSLWVKAFKTGELQMGILLHASTEVLDELEFKLEYAQYLLKRIAPEYALVSQELKNKKILEKSHMYFFLKP